MGEADEQVRCPHCDRTFFPAEAGIESPPETVPLPVGLVVSHAGGGLEISRRWFSAKLIPLVFFVISWDAFLLFWYATAALGSDGVIWIALVFPIAHVAVGVGLTYSVLAGLLNTTRVEVRSGRIRVRHGPVPWRGNLDHSTRDVDQIYVVKRERQNRNRNAVSGIYDVMLLSDDRVASALVRGLPRLDLARYIERSVEQRLSIADRPISDEVRD